MAISWGAWDYGSTSAGFRVGIEVTTSSVSSGSSSVTFTVKVYVEAMYNVDDSMTVTYGGSISGSSTQNLTTGSSGGTKLWGSPTHTYTYSTWGSSPGTRTFTASLSGVYNGANPTKSVTVSIPARPYATPAAPSGVTATRGASDASITVAWTRNATTSAPYSSVTVQRRKWLGGGGWGAWSTIATTSSTATSFLDTGGDPNTARQYQVRANNSSGSSAYVQAATTVKLTPAAVTSLAAAIAPAGTSIVLTWANNHYTGQGNLIKIQRSVAGGAYADVVTGLAETTTTWTDNTPGAGTNAYKVLVYTNGTPVLTSADAISNTVSTTVPPLAPTNLSPTGVAVDFTQAQVLSWQHNPGGDGAPQSSFILQTSIDGGTNWVTKATVTSAVSSWTMPGGTHTNGQSVLWRVQTRGVTAAGYGPNSANATLTGSATPVTTITGPATTLTTLPATATWTYSQAQSSAQAAWELELWQGAVLLQTASGTTATSSVLTYPIQDGTTLTLKVRTRSAAGIWSAWATRTITVTLASPAHITTTATYQPPTGTTLLELVASAPGAGEVAATSATVERRVAGGEWVTLATGVALPNTLLDLLPSTRKANEYRITAKSATPTYRQEAIVTVTPANALNDDTAKDLQWVFVNYGDGFTRVLRFRTTPKIAVTTGREKGHHRFLGRTRPIPQLGESRSRVVTVGGGLYHDPNEVFDDDLFLWDSPPADWEEAGLESEVVCYRDFLGRRVFGMLSDVAVSDDIPGLGSVGFTVTEDEWTEAYA